MIVSFNCKETQKIWQDKFSKKLPHSIQAVALRKLRLLESVDNVKRLFTIHIKPFINS